MVIMTPQLVVPKMRTFLTIWAGQLVSQTGSAMTNFALGVWIYQRTGSVSKFALIELCGTLGFLLMSPIAGAYADRWSRRGLMIFSDAVGATRVLILLLLWSGGRLELWHICVAALVNSMAGAFGGAASAASISLIVSKENLARANALNQIVYATAQIVGPIAAGIMLVKSGLKTIMMLDFLSFMVALGAFLIVTIPNPQQVPGKKPRLGAQILEGLKYVQERPGLLTLLLFFGGMNFLMTIVVVLLRPMLLSFTTADVLGRVLAGSGIAMLLGNAAITIWGGPKRRMRGVIISGAISSTCVVLAGLRPSAWLVGGMAFIYLLSSPVLGNCAQAILQQKVDPRVQGRVFSLALFLTQWSVPLAQFAAGPLADKVFEPWLSVHGLLAGTVGRIIGVGPGRGMGFMFIILGGLAGLGMLLAYLYRPFRLLEDQLPDAVMTAPSQKQAVPAGAETVAT
jgi:MFS transporter, DHA3 family, macrolide efflux protein